MFVSIQTCTHTDAYEGKGRKGANVVKARAIIDRRVYIYNSSESEKSVLRNYLTPACAFELIFLSIQRASSRALLRKIEEEGKYSTCDGYIGTRSYRRLFSLFDGGSEREREAQVEFASHLRI